MLDAGHPSGVELRLLGLIRRVFSIGLAGAVAGFVIGGIGGRIAMRISALAAGPRLQGVTTDAGNRVGEITLEGTIELIIFGGILSGLAAAVVVVALRPWLPRRWMGLAAGLLLLAVAGSNIIDGTNRDFLILDPPLLNVAMFGAIIVGFGVLTIPIAERIEARLGARDIQSGYGLVPLVAIGGLLAIPVYGSFFSSGFCECETPPVAIGVFVVVASVATVASWIYEVKLDLRHPWWVWIAGVGGTAGAVVLGLLRLGGELRLIF